MILLRVLNEYDDLCDPYNNGIASKKLIYDATKCYLESNDSLYFNKLSIKEKDKYIREKMHDYIVNHKNNLSKLFTRRQNEISNCINSFVRLKCNNSYYQLIYYLSTLPSHLVNGSKTFTNWISTTSEFDKIWPYYDKQKTHKVAILDLSTNGVFNEDTFVVDVSNKETIDKIKFLSKKINKQNIDEFIKYIEQNNELSDEAVKIFNNFILDPASKKFMGFNFSAASSEYSVYNYIDRKNIVSILEQLQIDLICSDIFNLKYLTLAKKDQIRELERLKYLLLKLMKSENNPYMFYICEKLYLNNENINFIVNTKEEKEKIISIRNLILSKAQGLPSVLIKK